VFLRRRDDFTAGPVWSVLERVLLTRNSRVAPPWSTVRIVSLEPKRPGRPPTFNPEKKPGRDVHVRISSEVSEAVTAYRKALGEESLSVVLRMLIRDRLTELGYLRRTQV
jgi:hypothetical protein